MAAWLEHASTWLVDHHWAPYLFCLLLFVAFAEAALFLGFVLPGEIALVLGGALCATGVFPLAAFLPAAIVAAILGGIVGYAVGDRYGEKIKASRLGQRVGDQRWAAGQKFFDDHGSKAVFFGRWVALLRALIPALAGMSHQRYRTFSLWNAVGGALWAGTVVLLGYVFAHSLTKVEAGLKYWSYAIIVLLVAGLLYLHQRRRSREKAEKAARADQTAQTEPSLDVEP
jgi:membrane-associated protein